MMLRKVSIHQPSYWPWLGLLDKIAKTNVFIIYDDAQVVKGSYQYRNIFYCNGEAKFLTLPINLKLGMSFRDLEFKDDKWKNDHLNKLKNYYLKSKYFELVYNDLVEFYQKDYNSPLEFLVATMEFAFKKFNISNEIYFSSDLKQEGKKGEKVLNLCKSVDAHVYLAGRGSREYLDEETLNKFFENGIEVEWHEFYHPVYDQASGKPFVSGLGCIDIFFFQGYEKSKEIFWRNVHGLQK